MMAPKTYRDPGSETLVTFVGGTLAGALAAGAVGALDAALLLYPIYYCVANGAIAFLIAHRRGTVAASSPARATTRPPLSTSARGGWAMTASAALPASTTTRSAGAPAVSP